MPEKDIFSLAAAQQAEHLGSKYGVLPADIEEIGRGHDAERGHYWRKVRAPAPNLGPGQMVSDLICMPDLERAAT